MGEAERDRGLGESVILDPLPLLDRMRGDEVGDRMIVEEDGGEDAFGSVGGGT